MNHYSRIHSSQSTTTLYYRERIKTEVLTFTDICYSVIPGFLPDLASHEILTRHHENTTRSLQQTKHELHELHRWQMLPNQPVFNHTIWNNTYPALNTNKQGYVNWKIAHRILPTALSLHHATVYHTSNCHRCHTTEYIEHIFLDWPTSLSLWTKQTFQTKA